ncbi:nucleoside-diphosphate-sugar epimerase family protein [Bombardia bombarda]|uniref:Nucleoside-diphosphate-sugar epimerase family protein n=1 Tax=Bombardia bombarda TaxID=252184 RepID=A0AA39XC01_9PEZI|nr:nucleoside-diphosphate-sugar epimerase family protein [Bombardia bombarda]
MAILLTGGAAAETAVRISELCKENGTPFVFASRRGAAPDSAPAPTDAPTVRFDWTDASTYHAPFAHVFPNGETIKSVYMVMPRVPEPDKPMNAFIDYAIEHGAKRFVLMAGTTATPGGLGPGQVWQHLIEKGVEYAICKPTWFMKNFVDGVHLKTICDESKVYSSMGDAKTAYVSSVDIGGVAYAALTKPEPPNTDYRISGPELLSYGEIASKLGKILGRQIEYVRLSPEERLEQLTGKLGFPEPYAKFQVFLEGVTAGKDYVDDTVEKLTGQKPQSFDEFAEKNKLVW